MILEGFANKLADIIVKGEVSIGEWRSNADAKINVSLSHRAYIWSCKRELLIITLYCNS